MARLDHLISGLLQRFGALTPRRRLNLPLCGRPTHKHRHFGDHPPGCFRRHFTASSRGCPTRSCYLGSSLATLLAYFIRRNLAFGRHFSKMLASVVLNITGCCCIIHAWGMIAPFPISLRPRERSWPLRGPRSGSSVRYGSGFQRSGVQGRLRRCVHRRLSGIIFSPRCRCGHGIPSSACKMPGHSAGWHTGFHFWRLRPGSPLSRVTVLADRNDRGGLAVDHGSVTAAGVISTIGGHGSDIFALGIWLSSSSSVRRRMIWNSCADFGAGVIGSSG